MLIHNKDDIEFVTEFPCFLKHLVQYELKDGFSLVIHAAGLVNTLLVQQQQFPTESVGLGISKTWLATCV